MNNKQLTIDQLDDQLQYWRKANARSSHKNGWIRLIRKALGITTKQLAKRMGVSRSRVVSIESAEKKNTLNLQTLAAVADALNCDLVFAIIPRTSLQDILDTQAEKIAQAHVSKVSHHMLLENQALTDEQNAKQVNQLKKKLLEKSQKWLWNE